MKNIKITQSITNRQDASLGMYFRDVSKQSLIDSEEEIKLAERIKKGDQKAIDKLVKANLRFEKLEVIDSYNYLKNVPTANGHYLIYRHNNYYNRDTHTFIIDPMHSVEGYIKKYRDENGMYHNMDGNYLIERKNNTIINRDGIPVISRFKSNLIDRG